jgi:hypothetical protein
MAEIFNQTSDTPTPDAPVLNASDATAQPSAPDTASGNAPVFVPNTGGPTRSVMIDSNGVPYVPNSGGPTVVGSPAATPGAPRTFGGDFKAGIKSAANPQYQVDPNTGQMTRVNPPRGSGGILSQILFGALSGAAKGLAAPTPPGAKGKAAATSAGAAAAMDAQDQREVRAQKAAEVQFDNRQAIMKAQDAHNQSVMTQIETARRMAAEDAELPLLLEKLGIELETAKNNRQISRQTLSDHQRQVGEDIENRINTPPVGRINLGSAPKESSLAPQQ